MAIREHSIYDCILRNALNLSGETALVSGDLRLTFSEIPIHVNCLARGLLNTGFEKGDRIAVLLNNCAEYALLLAACSSCRGSCSLFEHTNKCRRNAYGA